jgi:hypothetical protein
MSAITAIGTIGSLILQGVGMGLDIEAGQQADAMARRHRNEDIARSEKWASINHKLTLDEIAYNRRQAERAWKWKEEDRAYQRGQDFVNRFVGMLQQDQGLRNNFMNVWRRN